MEANQSEFDASDRIFLVEDEFTFYNENVSKYVSMVIAVRISTREDPKFYAVYCRDSGDKQTKQKSRLEKTFVTLRENFWYFHTLKNILGNCFDPAQFAGFIKDNNDDHRFSVLRHNLKRNKTDLLEKINHFEQFDFTDFYHDIFRNMSNLFVNGTTKKLYVADTDDVLDASILQGTEIATLQSNLKDYLPTDAKEMKPFFIQKFFGSKCEALEETNNLSKLYEFLHALEETYNLMEEDMSQEVCSRFEQVLSKLGDFKWNRNSPYENIFADNCRSGLIKSIELIVHIFAQNRELKFKPKDISTLFNEGIHNHLKTKKDEEATKDMVNEFFKNAIEGTIDGEIDGRTVDADYSNVVLKFEKLPEGRLRTIAAKSLEAFNLTEQRDRQTCELFHGCLDQNEKCDMCHQ